MVTIAPEREGAAAAYRQFVDAGVVAAVGHTDGGYEQTRAAIDAGATVGTHLFNAMRPINTREPGPVVALLEDPRVTVELITDGVHVDPALYRLVARIAGPDRVSLVTDAISAAGMPDGTFELGPLAVDVVAGGVARVAGTQTIAGSTATMDHQFRFAVHNSGLPRDEALVAAVLQASINPARALGLPSGGLVAGACCGSGGVRRGPRRDRRASPGIVGCRALKLASWPDGVVVPPSRTADRDRAGGGCDLRGGQGVLGRPAATRRGGRRSSPRRGRHAERPAAVNTAALWRMITRVIDEHARTDTRWLDYELDPAKLLDFPLMTDMREPLTERFHKAKIRADLLRPARAEDLLDDRESAAKYLAAVEDYVAAFDAAEAEAIRKRRNGIH